MSNLQEQNKALKQQGRELKEDPRAKYLKGSDNSSSSGSYTMISNSATRSGSGSGSEQAGRYDIAEMLRIKQELEAAKTVISRQEQELAETRNIKHTMDQAVGSASELDFNHQDISEQTIGHLQSAFNASARPFTSRAPAWRGQDDARSDSDFSAGSFGPRGWAQGPNNVSDYSGMTSNNRAQQAFASAYGGHPTLDLDNIGDSRSFSGSSSSLGYDPRLINDLAMYGVSNPIGRRNSQLRTNTLSDPLSIGALGSTGMSPPISPMGLGEQYAFGQRGMSLQPSPITPNFPTGISGQSWSLPVSVFFTISVPY